MGEGRVGGRGRGGVRVNSRDFFCIQSETNQTNPQAQLHGTTSGADAGDVGPIHNTSNRMQSKSDNCS